MLEHKGLYWSKVPFTEDAKTLEPDSDYILPFGKGLVVQEANPEAVEEGNSCVVVTYGMGVYWAKAATKLLPGAGIEILDLRTLSPWDTDLVVERVKVHGRVLVLTEEPVNNSFAQALAGKIGSLCFKNLDAPVVVLGSLEVPAMPLNSILEQEVLPNSTKTSEAIKALLAW
jgi:2-oxoisovalerate dehydrogenase E1 component